MRVSPLSLSQAALHAAAPMVCPAQEHMYFAFAISLLSVPARLCTFPRACHHPALKPALRTRTPFIFAHVPALPSVSDALPLLAAASAKCALACPMCLPFSLVSALHQYMLLRKTCFRVNTCLQLATCTMPYVSQHTEGLDKSTPRLPLWYGSKPFALKGHMRHASVRF